MKVYTGTKIIKARPMTHCEFKKYLGHCGGSCQNETCDTEVEEGYLVEYPPDPSSKRNHPDHEGYLGWSPTAVFDKAYRLNGELTFGDANVALNEGKRVARTGWYRSTFIWLLPAATIPKAWIKDEQFKKVADDISDTDTVDVLGTIRKLTEDSKILTGWAPSQEDIQATDWLILE